MLNDKIAIYSKKLLQDERGWFVKVIDGSEFGLPQSSREIYVTSAKPGESKGGDYSIKTNKWFTLIVGQATLILEDVESKERIEIELSSKEIKTIYVPHGIANKFINSGSDDFILVAYADNQYDKNDIVKYEL